MPHRDDGPIRMRAFTLVELLAVFVILSLVVGLGAQGLSSSHTAAKFREAITVMRDLDRHARAVARTRGPVRLMVNANGQSLTLLDSRTRDVVFAASLPQGITAEVETSEATQAIVFDRTGRTADYRIKVQAGGRLEELEISGLTGQAIFQSGAKS